VQPASPPKGTTKSADTADAPPAGENGGHDVGSGPAHDGDTSPEDQSREGPAGGNAPRQDPTESRLDPIWGADPPDAVRWHMDMTPGQEPSTTRLQAAPHPRATDPAAGAPSMPTVPPPPTAPGGGSSPEPRPDEALSDHGAGAIAPPAGPDQRPGQAAHERAGPQGSVGPEAGPASEILPTVPIVGPGGDGPPDVAGSAHGAETGSRGSGDGLPHPDPGAPTMGEGSSVASPPETSEPSSEVGWFSSGSGSGEDTGAFSERPGAERPGAELPPHPTSELQPPGEVPNDAGGAGDVTGDQADAMASTGQGGPAAQGGPMDHGGPVGHGSSTGVAGPLPDLAPLGSSSHLSSAGGGEPVDGDPSRTDDTTATGEAAGDGGSSGADAPAGTAGSSVDGGVGGARPVAGAEPAGGGPAGLGAASAGAATARPETPDTGRDIASAGTSPVPVPQGPGGPELIEAGMVYVDPDPEIGSAPRAAGWVQQPAAHPGAKGSLSGRPGPSLPPPDATTGDSDSEPGSDAKPSERENEAVATARAAAEGAGPPEATGGAGSPRAGDASEGVDSTGGEYATDGEGQVGIGDRVGAREAPEPGGRAEASGLISSSDTVESPLESAEDEDSWNEPALPMAWPLGVTPPGRPVSVGSLSEEPVDNDLVPEPDPTWPRLFGQGAESQPPGGPVGPGTGDQARASTPTDGGELSSEDPTDRPVTSQEGAAPAGRESAHGQQGPDHGPSDPSDRPGSDAAGTTVGIEAVGHANMSVAQRADVGEVDPRELSPGPSSLDVSRETSAGGGGGMDPEQENDAPEDEAAVAVREAVSRAAVEAGVDVSHETVPPVADPGIDASDGDPGIDLQAAARSARVTFRIDRAALNGDRRVMAVANQKGGVGKSTTAVNIGAYLALAGARILVVDLDPQGNASTGLGLDHRDIEPSIYDVLTGETSPVAAIRPTGVANLHVLPSTIDLAGAEVELVSTMSRETRLRRALESIDHQYDSILIDCPPSLGLLTVNALAAADELLIPIQCEYYALEGLGQLLRNVELVRANLNPDLRIGGIVLTMYDGRTRLALQVVDEVRKHFTDLVYQTVVPRSVRLSEAPGYGLPIALYDPLSRGGIAYRDLTFELAERSGLLAPTGGGAS
jgi:chromosome partitioning protein